MDSTDIKSIRAARPTNLARIASAFIFIVLYSFYDYKIVLYFALLQFTLSIFWFWLIEKKFAIYKNNPSLWYLPASIDVFFGTASVYITGVSYSPVITAYILITCMSSVDLIRARGLFTTISSSIAFIVILFLTKFHIIPYINILGSPNIEISTFSMIISALFVTMACFTANSVIYQIYFQLNEKNDELSSSLDKINLLKLQQDADYALTARLMEPFGGNYATSKYIDIELFLKQKKSFRFKNQELEIGGDILIAEELFFNNSKYILFANGDAMGKSMQGACGALVLGVISKSIISNAQSISQDNNIIPQVWLCNMVSEIHRIFESFEGSMLTSIFIGLIEEKTGDLFFINAEHPEAILYRDETTSFIKRTFHYSKLGTQGLQIPFEHVDFIKLNEGDILLIGSDGKDDLILKDVKTKSINQDEYLFPRLVQKANADLKALIAELQNQGNFSDDLSILKIHYKGLH